MLYVMSFRPRRWPIASGEPTTAIPRRESHPLPVGEKTLISAHIERLTLIEKDGHHRAHAPEPLHGLDGNRVWLALESPVTHPGCTCGGSYQHPHGRRTGTQQFGIVCVRAVAEKLEEYVRRELLGAARVGENAFRIGLELAPEARPAPARGGDPVVQFGGDRGRLWVEEPREPPHPIRLPGESKRTPIAARSLPVCDTQCVEFVPQLPSPPEEAVGVECRCLDHEFFRSGGQHRDRHVRGGLPEPGLDGVCRGEGQIPRHERQADCCQPWTLRESRELGIPSQEADAHDGASLPRRGSRRDTNQLFGCSVAIALRETGVTEPRRRTMSDLAGDHGSMSLDQLSLYTSQTIELEKGGVIDLAIVTRRG